MSGTHPATATMNPAIPVAKERSLTPLTAPKAAMHSSNAHSNMLLTHSYRAFPLARVDVI